jgi:hypothetical protein
MKAIRPIEEATDFPAALSLGMSPPSVLLVAFVVVGLAEVDVRVVEEVPLVAVVVVVIVADVVAEVVVEDAVVEVLVEVKVDLISKRGE